MPDGSRITKEYPAPTVRLTHITAVTLRLLQHFEINPVARRVRNPAGDPSFFSCYYSDDLIFRCIVTRSRTTAVSGANIFFFFSQLFNVRD